MGVRIRDEKRDGRWWVIASHEKRRKKRCVGSRAAAERVKTKWDYLLASGRADEIFGAGPAREAEWGDRLWAETISGLPLTATAEDERTWDKSGRGLRRLDDVVAFLAPLDRARTIRQISNALAGARGALRRTERNAGDAYPDGPPSRHYERALQKCRTRVEMMERALRVLDAPVPADTADPLPRKARIDIPASANDLEKMWNLKPDAEE